MSGTCAELEGSEGRKPAQSRGELYLEKTRRLHGALALFRGCPVGDSRAQAAAAETEGRLSVWEEEELNGEV